MTLSSGAWSWPIAWVQDVHDGDTLRLVIDNGFGSRAVEWIRLLDVRAPELNTPEGVTAREDVWGWLHDHAYDGRVKLATYRSSAPLEIRFRQSFTRYIGVVTALDGEDLNAWLRGQGYTDQGA